MSEELKKLIKSYESKIEYYEIMINHSKENWESVNKAGGHGFFWKLVNKKLKLLD